MISIHASRAAASAAATTVLLPSPSCTALRRRCAEGGSTPRPLAVAVAIANIGICRREPDVLPSKTSPRFHNRRVEWAPKHLWMVVTASTHRTNRTNPRDGPTVTASRPFVRGPQVRWRTVALAAVGLLLRMFAPLCTCGGSPWFGLRGGGLRPVAAVVPHCAAPPLRRRRQRTLSIGSCRRHCQH